MSLLEKVGKHVKTSEEDKRQMRQLDNCLYLIKEEYIKARRKFKPFHNLHEAYSILLEEVDELWEVVKQNDVDSQERVIAAEKEAKQIAAMALGIMFEFVSVNK